MKQTYKLNESELRSLIAECVQEVLNEEQKESLVGDMFRGFKQGIKNYNAGVSDAKTDMKSAKADYKAANKTNNNIIAWFDKDYETLDKMEQRYASVNGQIKAAVQNLKAQIYNAKLAANRNVTAKNTAYDTAKAGVKTAKDQRSQNMVNHIANSIYPNQQNTKTPIPNA